MLRERRRPARNDRHWGRKTQVLEQSYQQKTTQLEQQVVFLDQLNKCLRFVDMYLQDIVSNEDRETLDDSASTMVTCLNLARMSAVDMKGNKKALTGGKSVLAKFLRRCGEKYGGVEGESRQKLERVVGAVENHLVCVLNGGDVPVMQINGLDAESRSDEALANRAMQFVAAGSHKERKLRESVQQNVEQYREQVEEEAKSGERLGEAFGRDRFDDSARLVLQSDMLKLTPFANETLSDAQNSLNEMLARNKARDEEHVSPFDDYDSAMRDVSGPKRGNGAWW